MKKGDLCTNNGVSLFIYLGEGIWRGWSRVYELATGEKYQFHRSSLFPLKKNKKKRLTNKTRRGINIW